jgi:hypothetical protein
VRLWLARAETLADEVCTRVWRNLTIDEWDQFVADPTVVPYERTCPDLPSDEDVVMTTPAIVTPATPSALPTPSPAPHVT